MWEIMDDRDYDFLLPLEKYGEWIWATAEMCNPL
jgi:hypothetical protein